ncbi:MAG: beta-N-acetylhexosaminidase [Clostridia bacterium]|nr:beta-N-acetylhexosaminidase [Clostridia bacterium]
MKTGNFKRFGVMLDVSRNGAMKVSKIKHLIDCIAKIGYNSFSLYMEDMFEPEGEPYFGYLRGRYSKEELTEVVRYADSLGIEVFPRIEVLGHFTNLVRHPAYAEIVDCDDVLLIGDERTYNLIDKMFKFISEVFTSRVVCASIDEAFMLGRGRYMNINGCRDRFDIISEHVNKVTEIAQKYGLTPVYCLDMYYTLAGTDHYDVNAVLPQRAIDSFPKNASVEHWDYYNKNKAVYDKLFADHKKFSDDVWFTGGAWTWNGYIPETTQTLDTMRAAMQSVIENKINSVMITMWGDNGAECSPFTVLHLLYAIRQFGDGNFDMDSIKQGFFDMFGYRFDDFATLELPNRIDRVPDNFKCKHYLVPQSPTKNLLFSDPFLGWTDAAVRNGLEIAYDEHTGVITDAKSRAGEYAYAFDVVEKVSSVMELKMHLGIKTREAYLANDRNALSELLCVYGELAERVDSLHKSARTRWFEEYKGHGWEVHDIRLGGLKTRILSCKERLSDYIDGRIDRIEELEDEVIEYANNDLSDYVYRRMPTMCDL